MAFDELLQPKVISPIAGQIQAPPGFLDDSPKARKDPVKKPSVAEIDQLKVKKAWELATSPAKNVPANLLMSYMSGNSVQVISITMTLMLLWGPLKSIFTETNKAFASFSNERTALQIYAPKLVFVLCHLLNVAIGLWKLNKMGLIPNKEADWLSWQAPSVLASTVYMT